MRGDFQSVFGRMIRLADIFLFAISPLAILMAVVALIVLADRASEHNRFLRELRASGQVTNAEVSGIEWEYALVFVRYIQEGEERFGLLYTRYYPEAAHQLQLGQSLRVRYLPHGSAEEVIWEDHFSAVENYYGYAREGGIMLAVAWIIVVLHPEFLYLGYAGTLPDLNTRTRA
jgi:hypothetical protein